MNGPLEGNRFFPLEMKIFARQVRECNNLKLETIVLSGCQVSKNQLAAGYLSHLRAKLPVSITGSDLSVGLTKFWEISQLVGLYRDRLIHGPQVARML